MSMVITIASYKGGQGKSTTAIHLAAYYQDDNATLLIDQDPNKTATDWAAHNESRQFDVTSVMRAAKVQQERHYGVVINDTPARPEKMDLKDALEGAAIVIIPCGTDIFSLRTIKDAAADVIKHDPKRLRILLTNVPSALQKDGILAREALMKWGIPLFNTQIRHAKAFIHAQARGGFVQDVREDPRSYSAWSDYVSLGEEIDALLQDDKAPESTTRIRQELVNG